MKPTLKSALATLAVLSIVTVAFGSISGTLTSTYNWDADPNGQYYPDHATAKEDPLQLTMAINSTSNKVECRYTGWFYIIGPEALRQAAETTWEGEIYVKVNGQTYYMNSYPMPADKPTIPNVTFICDIPESAFNIGTNTVDFYCKLPRASNPDADEWSYSMSVTRT